MPRERRDPNFCYVHKTAVFQIHNPSTKKQRILRDALRRNHLAYSKLLPLALEKLDEISSISGSTEFKKNKARIGEVKKYVAGWVKPLPLGNATKVGLQGDLANAVAAHLALMDAYESSCEAEMEKPEDERKEVSKPGVPTFTRLVPHQ